MVLSHSLSPSLCDALLLSPLLALGTEMWYAAQLAHWGWAHLAGGISWEGVMKTMERLEKHLSTRKDKEKERGGDQGLVDLLLFLCNVAKGANLETLFTVLRLLGDAVPSLRPLVRLLEGPSLSFCASFPSPCPSSPGVVNAHWQLHNPLGLFCKTYSRAKRQEPFLSSPSSPPSASPSPLPSSYKEQSQDDQSAVGLQVRALTSLQLYLLERSPLTGERQRAEELSEESSEDEIISRLCAHDHERSLLLAQLYPLLRPSALKAQAAFALALQSHEDGALALAERQAFEAVYLLATLTPVKGLPLLLSEFGSAALDEYAAVLRLQGKYKALTLCLAHAFPPAHSLPSSTQRKLGRQRSQCTE